MNDIFDKHAVGMRIGREGVHDGDELDMGEMEGYLETHNEGTGGPPKKGKKGDIHGKEDAK